MKMKRSKTLLKIIFLVVVAIIVAAFIARMCPYRTLALAESITGKKTDVLRKYKLNINPGLSWIFFATYDFPSDKAYLLDVYPVDIASRKKFASGGVMLLWKRISECNTIEEVFIGTLTEGEAKGYGNYQIIKNKEFKKNLSEVNIRGHRIVVLRVNDEKYSAYIIDRRVQVWLPGGCDYSCVIERIGELL